MITDSSNFDQLIPHWIGALHRVLVLPIDYSSSIKRLYIFGCCNSQIRYFQNWSHGPCKLRTAVLTSRAVIENYWAWKRSVTSIRKNASYAPTPSFSTNSMFGILRSTSGMIVNLLRQQSCKKRDSHKKKNKRQKSARTPKLYRYWQVSLSRQGRFGCSLHRRRDHRIENKRS